MRRGAPAQNASGRRVTPRDTRTSATGRRGGGVVLVRRRAHLRGLATGQVGDPPTICGVRWAARWGLTGVVPAGRRQEARPLGRVAVGRFSRPVAGAPPDKIGGAFRRLLFSEAPRAQKWGGAALGAPRGGAEARRHFGTDVPKWLSQLRFNGRVFTSTLNQT